MEIWQSYFEGSCVHRQKGSAKAEMRGDYNGNQNMTA